MKINFSKPVFVVSCVVALSAVVATVWWILGLMLYPFPRTAAEDEFHEKGALKVIAFLYLIAPVLGGISLLCVIASGIAFSQRRQARDLWSLCLSGGTLLGLIGQIIYILHW